MGNKKTSAKGAGLEGPALGTLLSSVHLGGILQECVLEVSKGVATIKATDAANGIMIVCKKKVKGLADGKLGLSSLSLLCKFLKGEGEHTLSIDDDKLTIKRKKSGRISIRLLEPDAVPTAMEVENPKKKILASASTSFVLSEEAVKELISYMGLVDSGALKVSIKKGIVSASSKDDEGRTFTASIGKCDGEDMSSLVYSTYIGPVLGELTDKEVTVHMGQDTPIIITQGNNLWALSPLST